MSDPSYDDEVFDAFLIGWALALDMHGLDAPSAKTNDMRARLTDIAEGRLSLVRRPVDYAKTTAAFPELRMRMQDSMKERIERERALVTRLLPYLAAT